MHNASIPTNVYEQSKKLIQGSRGNLYLTLHNLSKKFGYCYANNKYLSQDMNQTERNIGKLLKSLEADGYITIENAGPKRIIRLTEKLSQMWTEFCKSTTAEFTSYPEQTDALTDDVTPNNRSTLPRTDVQAYPEQLGNSTEDETGLKALTGMPSDGAGKIPTLIYTKEDTIKKEGEAFASLHFVPFFKPKRKYKKADLSHQPSTETSLTEEDLKFRKDIQPILSHKDFRSLWNAFKENSQAKRNPVTKSRAQLLLKDLLDFSGGDPERAIAILSDSVKGGWSKFYRPKDDRGDKIRTNSGWLDPSLDNRLERKLKVIDFGNDDTEKK